MSLPRHVHMVEGLGGRTISTVKCLLLIVIRPFYLYGYNFSRSIRHCIQILHIHFWSVRNKATSDNWVLLIIWCSPVDSSEVMKNELSYLVNMNLVKRPFKWYHIMTLTLWSLISSESRSTLLMVYCVNHNFMIFYVKHFVILQFMK